MLQVHVRPYVTDPVERVGLQDAIAEGVGPNSTNDGENVVYCLRGQALLEQLCLKQLDIALADVDKPLSMSNVDAELLGILKITGTDLARIYKIPPHMINDLEKASYNSLEQLLIQYVIFALMPWVKRHEEAMMRDFLLPGERRRYFIEFNLSGLLRGDQKSRYDSYAVGRQWGWLSINDIRRLENMPPVANGDIYLQPLNMTDVANELPNMHNPNVRAQLEQQRDDIVRMLAA